ncbi:MAG TPA: RT0821/Lpp0805 family surface protein [Mesorhizobium sp.]
MTSGGSAVPGSGGSIPKPAVVRGMQGGGLAGTQVGRDLSAADRRTALDAEYRALENTPGGQTVAWKGAEAGTGGQVVPGQPYRVGSQDCRQYTHTILAQGSSASARGTACRNADGTWTPLT